MQKRVLQARGCGSMPFGLQDPPSGKRSHASLANRRSNKGRHGLRGRDDSIPEFMGVQDLLKQCLSDCDQSRGSAWACTIPPQAGWKITSPPRLPPLVLCSPLLGRDAKGVH